MKLNKTNIKGLVEIEASVFEDERGYFFESYNKKKYSEIGIDAEFVQDNQSKSQKGVLRGLHLQKKPFAQAKLVKVIKGSVLDVAVDLRKDSKTYGQYHSVVLSGENKKSLWIPEGFAHGFLTLEDDTIFTYKVSNYYNKESELCIKWNDEDLNINWQLNNITPMISDKDKEGIKFENFSSDF